ncbi:hypothetical protein D9M68_666770 [compost metagenome]
MLIMTSFSAEGIVFCTGCFVLHACRYIEQGLPGIFGNDIDHTRQRIGTIDHRNRAFDYLNTLYAIDIDLV